MAGEPKSIRDVPSGRVRGGGLVGRYQLMRLLGRGGMAEVWLARVVGPAKFERKVVVKRILEQFAGDESFAGMFLAEARLCARLSHPNIVAVHELGEDEGRYFIAMEYVRGHDLRELMREMKRGGPLDPGMGVYAMREVARALMYAHSLTDDEGKPLRLVHRDVSHSNVMISFEGDIKLVDFGLAKALGEIGGEHTRTGVLKGKFGYMAPEQFTTTSLDHRIDLWAAGVMLWELLTGTRLFRGDGDVQTMAMVREKPIEPPSTFNPKVSPELDAIVLKALDRDRDQRYLTGTALAAALEGVSAIHRFGPDEMRQLMLAHFDERPSNTSELEVELVDAPPTGMTTPQQPAVFFSPPRTLRRVLVLGGLAVVGVTVLLLTKSPGPAAPSPSPATTASVVLPPAPSLAPVAPPIPLEIEIRIETTPAGALVLLDGAERGRSPLSLSLPRAGEARRLEVTLEGYESKRVQLVPERDARFEWTLHHKGEATASRIGRAERPHAAAKSTPAPATAPSSNTAPRATDKSKLRDGMPVDPFE